MSRQCSALSLLSQSVLSGDDSERDPEGPGVVLRLGAGRRAEPHPASSGQRGVPFSGHRHQPAADVQGHSGNVPAHLTGMGASCSSNATREES